MPRALSDDWKNWLRENRDRGCSLDDLFARSLRQGFDPDAIAAELGGYRPAAAAAPVIGPTAGPAANDPWFAFYHAPLTRPENQPRAWRLDTPFAQLYEVPGFLSGPECEMLMAAIDTSLQPSTVTRGPEDYRTSRTCHLRKADPDLVRDIDRRIAALIGVDPSLSEPIQGQRYDAGQYFKAHTDWFAPGTKEFELHTRPGGQRTWTVMIYLNHVTKGGGTRFERVGRDFYPVPGVAVAWNNINVDGTPNHYTLHEALPVLQGCKYVITKWFRESPGRNS